MRPLPSLNGWMQRKSRIASGTTIKRSRSAVDRQRITVDHLAHQLRRFHWAGRDESHTDHLSGGIALDDLVLRHLPAAAESWMVSVQHRVQLEDDVDRKRHIARGLVNQGERVAIPRDLLL